MLIGYARVSTNDQSLDLQRDALSNAGCEAICDDVVSGSKDDRPGLNKALEMLRPGDTLVVWRLDRLGRSIAHLIEIVTALKDRGVGFRSLTENIDTESIGGRLVFNIFAALADFERELIRERTKAGLTAARARGRVGGRPKSLKPREVLTLRRMVASQNHSMQEIARAMGVSRKTVYRYAEGVARA